MSLRGPRRSVLGFLDLTQGNTMKSARKTRDRRKMARLSPAPLTLSARVERLEKVLLFPRSAPKLAPAATRFTKLYASAAPSGADHAAVFDSKTGLTWSAEPLGGKELNHAAAMKACADLDLMGHKDWRAPTIQELLSIVDYTRYDPAVDTDFFKGPYGWTWSSTLAKAPSGFAWYVGLILGYSFRYNRDGNYFVRAVRAGQQLAIGI